MTQQPVEQAPAKPTLTQAVNALNSALTDYQSAKGNRTAKQTAVDDAKSQVTTAEADLTIAQTATNTAQADAVAAFDTAISVLQDGKADLLAE